LRPTLRPSFPPRPAGPSSSQPASFALASSSFARSSGFGLLPLDTGDGAAKQPQRLLENRLVDFIGIDRGAALPGRRRRRRGGLRPSSLLLSKGRSPGRFVLLQERPAGSRSCGAGPSCRRSPASGRRGLLDRWGIAGRSRLLNQGKGRRICWSLARETGGLGAQDRL